MKNESTDIPLSTSQIDSSQEGIIELNQIIDFFYINFKKVILGVLVGLILGLAYWFIYSPYKGELTLLNKLVLIGNSNSNSNSNGNSNSNSNGNNLDILGWQQLVKSLPHLAKFILSQDNYGGYSHEQLLKMTSSKWWSKNVSPNFTLTKSDIKDMTLSPRDLEAGNVIVGFSINDSGHSALSVQKNLQETANFIRSGGSLLALQALLGSYELRLTESSAYLTSRLNDTQLKIEGLRRQSTNLELLQKKFPNSPNIPINSNAQNGGIKIEDIKFFPISSRLIAINSDLIDAQEELSLLHRQETQLKLLGDFTSKAKVFAVNNFDGLNLVDKLIEQEQILRKNLKSSDLYEIQILDEIHLDLLSVKRKFGYGLEAMQNGSVGREWALIPLAIGSFLGGLLAIFSIGARFLWHRYLKSKGGV
jgi:hypothetical protein